MNVLEYAPFYNATISGVVCANCGCVVGDLEVHNTWHIAVMNAFGNLATEVLG